VVKAGKQDSSLVDVKELANMETAGGKSARDIIDRARAGDPEAFQAIFQRFVRPVQAFIYHMLGDKAGAEELTQETFVRAYRRLDRIEAGSRPSTWLFGIARNVVREAIRNRRRSLREVDLNDATLPVLRDARAGPDENFMTQELQRVIRRSVRELSNDQRLVFVLKVLHRMRYEEISVITGSSIGKLKTDLHRARLQVRQRLQPYLVGRISGT
jgi:RNA polymerase sigma-70 factor (ECF subfamily)